MKQIATVERILDRNLVEVSVRRASACGHGCEDCPGCGADGGAVLVTARDMLGVRVGEKVVIQSQSGAVLGAAAAVYLLPILFFFVGYALSTGVDAAILRAAVVLGITVLGFVPAIALDRRGRRIVYTIQERR